MDASARLRWDDRFLYVLVKVEEAGFYTGFTTAAAQPDDFTAAGQPKLWTYEIEINPQNRVFKSRFDTLQQPNGGPNGPFGHEDWDPKLRSAVTATGPHGQPTGYTVEIAIPWAAFGTAKNRPPAIGEAWRMNLYAMKQNMGVAWSPILGQGNFHKASRFSVVGWGPVR